MESPVNTPVDIRAFYDIVHRRRDVRAEFTGEPVERSTLARLLSAAHAAPSVGLTQPWDFIVVDDDDVRQRFESHVRDEQAIFAASLEGDDAQTFSRIKIDGILESSLSVVVTYDAERGGPAVLGRHAIADAGLYSTCLAIENLWLSCVVEGWGLGWVSFYREQFLQDLLHVPARVRPVAWLCLGPVSFLQETPDLERHGWRQRRGLDEVLHVNDWGGRADSSIFDLTTAAVGGSVGRPLAT